MAALGRLASILLRAAQVGFAVIVAAIVGSHLHRADKSSGSMGRFIYTEIVAGISIFLGLIWLLPFSSTFSHWPVDAFISALWWVTFGLLVNLIKSSCGPVFNWANVAPRGDECGKFKTNIAFSFLSAIIWLASATVGMFWVRRYERRNTVGASRV